VTALVTALVVDDEPMVRHLVRRILEPEVCAVVEADDGESALRLLQRQAAVIDLVVTDLVMPGIDGFDVVEVLSRHVPDLPVVCMTGYTGQLAPLSEMTAPLLPKPFTAEALREVVTPLVEQCREARGAAASERSRARDLAAASQNVVARGREAGVAAVDLVAAARALRSERARGAPAG
jgi:CheY-like chemotaxis protein